MDESKPTCPGKLLGFLLIFVVLAALPPQAMYWDGIGFLEYARPPLQLDLGHALYVPLLRAWHLLLAPIAASEEYAAKLLSACAAALVFLLLWIRIERKGVPAVAAIGIAVLAVTSPVFWRQAGVMEPTTLTIAALLGSAALAERYGEERKLSRLAWLTVSIGVLLGLHVVSVCALPWLAALARGPAGRPPRNHLLVPLGLTLALALLIVLSGGAASLATFFGYWRGFLPSSSLAGFSQNATTLERFLFAGQPLLSIPALISLAGLLVVLRRIPRDLVLGLPYLVAFLVLGQPVVGLLVPLGVALALVLADGLAALPRVRLALILGRVALPLLLAVQIGNGLFLALHRAVTPDEEQERAILLAGALPAGAVLLAGPVAHHIRWFTAAPVVALPNELHARHHGPDGRRDPIEIVRAVAARERPHYDDVYISSEALHYLEWRFGEDPRRLAIDTTRVILVRARPDLFLAPLLPPGISAGLPAR